MWVFDYFLCSSYRYDFLNFWISYLFRPTRLGTCEASWFDSISNHTSDSRFDSYWWSDSKFSNPPRCQSSFVKKRLVVVKFAFKVDFWSKISVQQHCLFYDWIEINKYSVRSSVVRTSLSFVTNTKYRWIKYNTHLHNASRQHIIGL